MGKLGQMALSTQVVGKYGANEEQKLIYLLIISDLVSTINLIVSKVKFLLFYGILLLFFFRIRLLYDNFLF